MGLDCVKEATQGHLGVSRKHVLLMLLESLSHSVSHSKYQPITLTQSKTVVDYLQPCTEKDFTSALTREVPCVA